MAVLQYLQTLQATSQGRSRDTKISARLAGRIVWITVGLCSRCSNGSQGKLDAFLLWPAENILWNRDVWIQRWRGRFHFQWSMILIFFSAKSVTLGVAKTLKYSLYDICTLYHKVKNGANACVLTCSCTVHDIGCRQKIHGRRVNVCLVDVMSCMIEARIMK